MIVLTNDTTSNAKGLKPLSKIVKSLSKKRTLPSEKNKKNRHSLKLLCFHPPAPSTLPVLLDMMKEEIKSKSDYFLLLCHHIISHAQFAGSSPQAAEVIQQIGKLILTVSKKPNKRLSQFYRVLFHLCFYSQAHYNFLIDINEKILTMNVDLSKDSMKPYSELMHECLFLLVDLPNFEKAASDLLSRKSVVQSMLNIYKSTNETRNKLSILNFLSRISANCKKIQIPNEFFNIIDDNDPLLDSAIASNFLVYNYDKFLPQITFLLRKKVVSSTRIVQLRLIETNPPNELIIESISSQITPKESCLLPLLHLLEKAPRGAIDSKILTTLYQVYQNNNPTIAILSFMCICFISEEIDWLKESFVKILNKFAYTPRCSVINLVLKSWDAALDDAPGNKNFIIPLFEILLMKFGDCIDQIIFDKFIQKVNVNRVSDEFLNVFKNCLANLPPLESVIFIFYGASQLRDFAHPQVVSDFMEVAQKYMIASGPGLQDFYAMTLNPMMVNDNNSTM